VPVIAGDLDNDGNVDLLWQHLGDGQVSAWSMSGVQQIAGFALTPAQITDTNWRIVGSADPNHDGHMDLYWQHQTTGALSVWLMKGSQLETATGLTPSQSADPQWTVRTVTDLDRDGEPDLIWQHAGSGHVAAWFMNQLVLREGALLQADPVADLAWTIVGAGDANRDGSMDLYWHHRTSGWASVWLMQGANLLRGDALDPHGVADTTYQVRGVGDLDRNGIPDLLWQRTVPRASGGYEVAAWLMTGPEGRTLATGTVLDPPVVPDAGWLLVGPR
jgi:hypothetical protein